MKIFANKKIWKKFIVIFIIIYLMTLFLPTNVQATENAMETFGGSLLEPFFKLLVGLGDGVVSILHRLIIGQNQARLWLDWGNTGTAIISILTAVVLVTVAIALTIATGGLSSLLVPALVIGAAFALNPGVAKTAYTFVQTCMMSQLEDDRLVLPLYNLSPEEIFKGKKVADKNKGLGIFNVNFWNPDIDPYETVNNPTGTVEMTETNKDSAVRKNVMIWQMVKSKGYNVGEDLSNYDPDEDGALNDPLGSSIDSFIGYGMYAQKTIDNYLVTVYYYNDGTYIYYLVERFDGTETEWGDLFSHAGIGEGDKFAYNLYVSKDPSTASSYTRGLVEGVINEFNITISSMQDLAGDLMNGNSSSTPTSTTTTSSDPVKTYSFAYLLQNTVITWYNVLRVIAIIGMMSVLVYIGIRILISSTASDKAKYKQMLGDWFMGMILLFTMHYIMYFSNLFVDQITDVLSEINPGFYTYQVFLDDENNKQVVMDQLNNSGYQFTSDANQAEKEGYILADDETNPTFFFWHTNLMGYLRMEVNNSYIEGEGFVGYTILFLILVIYTIIFTFIYIKRVVYMAFLTIIAPLVALTYPIDKVNDGKAQGFDIWFKEYIFNLLLQPVHLLLYTILIASAIKLALSNPIYAIVAMGFMMPAEKLLRQMFNFNKASTPGVFEGATGAAMTMSMVKWLTGHGPNGGKKGNASGGRGEGQGDDGKVSSTGKNKIKMADNYRGIGAGSESGAESGSGAGEGSNGRNTGNEQNGVAPIGPGLNGGGQNNGQNNDQDDELDETGQMWQSWIDRNSEESDDESMSNGVQDDESIRFNDDNIDLLSDEENYPDMEAVDFDNQFNPEIYGSDGMYDTDGNWNSEKEKYMRTEYPELKKRATQDEIIKQRIAQQQATQQRVAQQQVAQQRATQQQVEQQRAARQTRTIRPPRAIQRQTIAANGETTSRSVLNGLKYGANNIGHNLKRNIKNQFTAKELANTGKRLARGAAGIAGAATLGSLALAGGVATGDFGKTMSAAGMGLAGGYKLGGNIAGSVLDGVAEAGKGTVDEFKRGYYGNEAEYQRAKAEKEQKKMYENRENIRKVQEKLEIDNRKQAEELTKEMVQMYADNNITDMDEMIKIEKIAQKMQKDSGRDMELERKNAISGHILNQTFKFDSNIETKKRNAMKNRIKNTYDDIRNEDQLNALMNLGDRYIKFRDKK